MNRFFPNEKALSESRSRSLLRRVQHVVVDFFRQKILSISAMRDSFRRGPNHARKGRKMVGLVHCITAGIVVTARRGRARHAYKLKTMPLFLHKWQRNGTKVHGYFSLDYNQNRGTFTYASRFDKATSNDATVGAEGQTRGDSTRSGVHVKKQQGDHHSRKRCIPVLNGLYENFNFKCLISMQGFSSVVPGRSGSILSIPGM